MREASSTLAFGAWRWDGDNDCVFGFSDSRYKGGVGKSIWERIKRYQGDEGLKRRKSWEHIWVWSQTMDISINSEFLVSPRSAMLKLGKSFLSVILCSLYNALVLVKLTDPLLLSTNQILFLFLVTAALGTFSPSEVFAFLAFSPARNKTKFASPNFCNSASCSFRATLDPTCRASIAKSRRISSPTIEWENLLPGVVWSHWVGELRQLHLKSKSFLRWDNGYVPTLRQ